MTLTHRIHFASAAFLLFLATVFGAYGSHGLQGSLSASEINAYQTAVEYQFFHALGLMLATLLALRFPASYLIAASCWFLLIGIILFSGAIYATSFGAPAGFGAAAPIGGTAFMLGWLALGIGILRAK